MPKNFLSRSHAVLFLQIIFKKPLEPESIQHNWMIYIKSTQSMNFVYSAQQGDSVILLLWKFWYFTIWMLMSSLKESESS